MRLAIVLERSDRETWLADVTNAEGAVAIGKTPGNAVERAVHMALNILADQIENAREDCPVCNGETK
ncbi:MAG: type II toxin-antitoxin system HicB family antitoxin [Deltaproteobacteria bacterium]|nr:type II toxin-antitoxin system HicB family antitoxin [Deltaproteobacteria bacterium]